MNTREQLQWLLDNLNKIQIKEIYPDGDNGTPTLLIEFDNWDIAYTSPFKIEDNCIMFE